MSSDIGGGFLVAPEQFVAQLIQDIDRMVWFRQFATVIPLQGAESLGVPSLATDIADTVWTTELAVGTEDTSLAFGKRRLTPHPLAKYIKVSKDLLRSAALSVEAIVRERLAYKFGTVQETAFMTGTGAGSPLGIFTASDNGITTSQDVATDNTATTITADGLINAKYGLEAQWLGSPNLRWVFHRDAVKMIRKLKDGDGQYLWNPGLATDRPDTILNVPVLVSEYAPNTFTASKYVGLIGDLSYYWIAETMSVEIQRLIELGALTNQDYFIGRAMLDGMPVLEKAFVRVTLST
jgi:HK97 family phage major capsid protein